MDGPAGPAPDGSPAWSLVANLPYNVATPVVVRVLEEAPQVRSLLVMVQREVGERMAAAAGDPSYGAVSVKVAYWATASVVGRVPPTVFVPRPKVESALVRIERRDQPAVPASVVSYERLFQVVRAGFSQRRKMLRRSLAGVVEPEAFAAAGVAPEARAEELDVEEWGRLSAMGRVNLVAPAKLTLSLRVLGRRADGYHELTAEMVSLDLADTLVVDPDGDGLEVEGDGDPAQPRSGSRSRQPGPPGAGGGRPRPPASGW